MRISKVNESKVPSPPALRGWERVRVRGVVQQMQDLEFSPDVTTPLIPTFSHPRAKSARGEKEKRAFV
jgi:hypothetical protein